MRVGTRVLAGAVCAVGAALVAGCSGGGEPVAKPSVPASETPSLSASPSVDPAEALKQQNIETAKALIAEYEQQVAIVENNGGADWQDLSVYLNDAAYLSSMGVMYDDWSKRGVSSTGSYVIESQEVAGYDGTPGAESVRLDVCIDSNDVLVVGGSGAGNTMTSQPARRVDFLVTRQNESYWTIDEQNETGEWC